MKRNLLLIVVPLLVVVFAVNSAPAIKPAAQAIAPPQITLTYWQVPNHPQMKELCEELLEPFEQAHPNIKVDVVVIPWSDVEAMWKTAIQSGETPDVGYMFDVGLPVYARMGGLEPLDSYLSEEFLARYVGEIIKTGILPDDGKLYGLPMVVSSDVLYYNKDMFEKAGIPLPDPLYSPTWEEFLDWNLKLKDAGFYGWDWGIRTDALDHVHWDVWRRFGASDTSADYTKMTFDTPEMLAWATAMQDLAQKHKVLPPKALTVDWVRSEAFLQGQAGLLEFWLGLADIIAKDYPELKWGVCKPFHGPGSGGEATAAYLGVGYQAVFKDSKHKAEAIELLKFLSGDEFLFAWNKAIGAFPPVKGGEKVFDEASAEKQLIAKVVWSQLESGEAKFYYSWPGVLRWGSESFIPDFQAVLLGKMSPEDFCRRVNEAGDRIIAEAQE